MGFLTGLSGRRDKTARLQGALDESRKERRELSSRAASFAAKYLALSSELKNTTELKEHLAAARERAAEFESKYAKLASDFKRSAPYSRPCF